MIGRLCGRIARRQPQEILLDVGGVGYRVAIPLGTFCALPEGEEPATLEIHMLVREDALQLFGFATETEKTLFEALLSVSGVGPKVALAVLSGFAPSELARAIEEGDSARIRTAPGVGRKLAERIVLELKEKVSRIAPAAPSSSGSAPRGPLREAESALVNLGYPPVDARSALEEAARDSATPAPLEALLRDALRILAR